MRILAAPQGVHQYWAIADLDGIDLSSFDGITNSGTIFGSGFGDNGNSWVLYTIQRDELATFELPNSPPLIFISGVNDRNEIVSHLGTLFRLSQTGGSVNLPLDDYADARFYDVNNRGEIVGSVIEGGMTSGFILGEDGVRLFDHPLGGSSFSGINDHGLVTGSLFNEDTWRGFVFDGEEYQDVVFPGARRTEVIAINNHGVMAGNYQLDGSSYKGFIAFPVPEPSAGLLLLSAFVMLSMLRWHRSSRGLIVPIHFSRVRYRGESVRFQCVELASGNDTHRTT